LGIPAYVKSAFVKIPLSVKKKVKISLLKIPMALPMDPEACWGASEVLVDERTQFGGPQKC